jgi:hypothetical protein
MRPEIMESELQRIVTRAGPGRGKQGVQICVNLSFILINRRRCILVFSFEGCVLLLLWLPTFRVLSIVTDTF